LPSNKMEKSLLRIVVRTLGCLK